MARAFLIRHGQTPKDGHPDRMESTGNSRLTARGRQVSEDTAHRLIDSGIEEVTHSGVERNKQSAEIISNILGVPLTEDEGLETWPVGPTIDGKPKNQVQGLIDFHMQNPHLPLPGGSSYGEFLDNWHKGFMRTIQKARKKNIAAVTHSPNFASLNHIISGKAVSQNDVPVPGGIVCVEVDDDGSFEILPPEEF